MSTTIARKLVTAGLLSLCAAGLSVQAQTASPGPPSRNANVDKEDPNKPDTPEHEVTNQAAPGSGTNKDSSAAGEATPSANDGSPMTENRDPTQPIPRDSAEQNATAAEQEKNSHQQDTEDDNKDQSDSNTGQAQDGNTGNEQGDNEPEQNRQ